MTNGLAAWVADVDSLKYTERLGLDEVPPPVRYLIGREDDYFLSLVGELFDRLRGADASETDWALLGNAFAEFGFFRASGVGSAAPADAALFAAVAFYLGGFSASANLMLSAGGLRDAAEGQVAAYELLARPIQLASPRVQRLLHAVRAGDDSAITEEVREADDRVAAGLKAGPEEWVGWRLYREIVTQFARTNVRAVLPSAPDGFWDRLVGSFLRRSPPVWDFFPSQISAIESGLLDSEATFSLQMPTGSGKTALTETAIYSHLGRHPEDVAVLLVPYRALAKELRDTMVFRLNAMGLTSRSMYGGTVPTGDEIHALEDVRVLVATPESLSGLLNADPSFFRRISLVVCDEGHLLDGPDRGVALELLLARMRALGDDAPRFVFVSAIVPNIDEVNAWLGGTSETVVGSSFRPALAEFARLDTVGSGGARSINLRFHPHESTAFDIQGFLRRDDFLYLNAESGRFNTYPFTTIKTQAVAAARKALQMGPVAVFAANKRGNQGCVGLAEELLAQLKLPMSLPNPSQFVGDQAVLQHAVDYLALEYGSDWIGTRALRSGALVHHGDVPQESREVVEDLLRRKVVALAFCTNTLAEGVNLPLRSIVLYSVQRRLPDGRATNLLSRDIKNLVGRAGRAGSATRGLVLCANPQQWEIVEPVARQAPGEPVHGALLTLLRQLRSVVVRRSLQLTNEMLEATPRLHSLIDGVDATLIDLATEELDEEELVRLAGELTEQTYAQRGADTDTTALMRTVFQLRARRIWGVRQAGRLRWIYETGARPRILDSVEQRLLVARERWDDLSGPTDPGLTHAVLQWFSGLPGVAQKVRDAFRDETADWSRLQTFVELWLAGRTHREIAASVGVGIDDALAIHAGLVTYELQTAAEQGIALLGRLCEAQERAISTAVLDFPEHLRFGVPNTACRLIAAAVRHRRAAVALGQSDELAQAGADDGATILRRARALLDDTERWLPTLGRLVLANTRHDLRRFAEPQDSPEA